MGGLKVPKIENEALKNNVLSSLRPMDENPIRHEQDFYNYTPCFFISKYPTNLLYNNHIFLIGPSLSESGPPIKPTYLQGFGGFQLEFVFISWVINLMTCYKLFQKKSFTRFAVQSELKTF